MSSLKTKSLNDQISKILNQMGMFENQIESQNITFFESILEPLFQFSNITDSSTNINQQQQLFLSQRLLIVLQLFKKKHKAHTLALIIKKIVFIHLFIYKASKKGPINSDMIQLVQKQINKIRNQQLSKLCQPVRQNKINQIIGYVRQISRSKDSTRDKKSVQKSSEKGAVRQLIKNILDPYCCYLIRVISEEQLYSFIIKRSKEKKYLNQKQTFWKIWNWAKKLSECAVKLNKFCRAFASEMTGKGVYICFAFSMDISIYYDALNEYIVPEIQKWRQRILKIDKETKMNKLKSRLQRQLIARNPEFIEIKRQLQQMCRLKEDINYIYMSKIFKKWVINFHRAKTYIYKQQFDYQFIFNIKQINQNRERQVSNQSKIMYFDRDKNKTQPDIPIQNQTKLKINTKIAQTHRSIKQESPHTLSPQKLKLANNQKFGFNALRRRIIGHP